MRRVAMFREDFLPYSQTFVFEELRLLERYRADVFAWRRLNADLFPHEPVYVGGVKFLLTGRSSAFHAQFRSRSYDLVHAHFGTSAMYALPYSTRYHLPLVVTFHGVDVTVLDSWARLLPHRWPYAWLAPRVLGRMTTGLCVSNEIRDRLLALNAPPDRLVVHRLGIDLGLFTKGPRDPARVEVIDDRQARGEEGVRIRPASVCPCGRARTAHVPDDRRRRARRARLERLAQALGVAERVTFTGVLSSRDVGGRLQRSDVLLAPSVTAIDGNREGSPVVVKEASASEVVPVGTHHGGIPETIDDNETGFVVSERDVEALADRLGRLVRDPALRARMGEAARHKMEREFDNRARVKALEDRYDEAVQRYAEVRNQPR